MSFVDKYRYKVGFTVFREAVELSYQKTKKIGISIDIDAFDYTQMPGTDLHVSDGICVKQFLEALNCIQIEGLIGVEIAEYNPHKDIEHKTAQSMADIIKHIFQEKSHVFDEGLLQQFTKVANEINGA